MNKDIITIVLVIALIILGGVSYYLYSGARQCKAVATDLGAKLQECGGGLEQYKAGLDGCVTQATQCKAALTDLQEICAPYLLAQ